MKLRTGFAASTAAALALALALLPATAASAVPLPTGDLTGTVEDPSGNPVSDANVSVASASHLYAATTGADGTFSFPSIPAGEYRVGWYKFGAYPIGLESTENVVTGDTTELQLVIPNTSEMTVTVTDGVNPLEDAFVSYVSDDYGVSNGGVFTGPDGVFSTGDLPVGTYNIYVEGPPGSDFVSEWYEDVLFRGAATDIVLTENGDTEAFVIALGTSPYHLTGTVEADGSPVEGASVSVLYGTLGTYDPTSPSAFAETDANGDYNSQGLVSGTYVVIARWYDPVDEVSYVSEPQEVVIDDASAELDLQVAVEEDIITVTTGRPDHYATPENTVLNVSAASGLLANDTVVPPSDEFEVGDLLSLPQHGEVFVSYSGALTYAPETGFTGTDTFTYESGPEGQGSGAVLVTIQVGTLPVTGGDHGGAPLAIALLALGTGLALAVVVRRRATA